MIKGWEKPKCNICNTDKYLSVILKGVTTWEHPGKFNFVKCQNCGLVFQSPRAPFEKAVDYYPSESYWGDNVKKIKKDRYWKKERAKTFNFLYKGILKRKKFGKILDIGSGSGRFLTKFKELNWEVLGTDISKDVAKYSKTVHGINVLVGEFTEMKFKKNYFDVVSLNAVLEHVYNPSKTLRKISDILKTDGILVIVVPNIESLGYYIHKKYWMALQPGRHLYQFSPKTIKVLLDKNGFEIDEINHNYWAHNFYHYFENIRFRFSPKFKVKDGGGAVISNIKDILKPSPFSIKKEVGKSLALILAVLGSFAGSITKRGEIITIYAKKRS